MTTSLSLKSRYGILANAIVEKFLPFRAFFTEFVHAPLFVGSVCPSSKALADTLIELVSADGDGLIIDLGAGSGIVTEELLRAGVSPDRIIAIEISEGFRDLFMARCPGVPLVIGDARDLEWHCNRLHPGKNVANIISSLPLRALPNRVVDEIMAEMARVLHRKGGVLVQYTYALWMRYPLKKYGFSPHSARYVPRNIPPARVERYTCGTDPLPGSSAVASTPPLSPSS